MNFHSSLLRQAPQQIKFEAERDGVTCARLLSFSFIGVAVAVILFLGVRP